MNKFMKLLKNGRVGNICKISAIVIALIGTMYVILQFYAAWMIYQIVQSQSGEQIGISPSIQYYTYLMPNITSLLGSATATIFYVTILYTAGVIINAYFVTAQDGELVNKEDETAITYGPIDDDNEVIIESIDRRR